MGVVGGGVGVGIVVVGVVIEGGRLVKMELHEVVVVNGSKVHILYM